MTGSGAVAALRSLAAPGPFPRDEAARILGAYAGAIVVAEAVLAFWGAASGALIHAVILLALVNHAAWGRGPARRLMRPLLALALIPLMRLTALGTVQPDRPDLMVAALVWLPLLLTVVIILRLSDPAGDGAPPPATPGPAGEGDSGPAVRLLTPAEAQRLGRRSRTDDVPSRRQEAVVVLASASGMDAPGIARLLGWDEIAVTETITAFNEHAATRSDTRDRSPEYEIRDLYRTPPPGGDVVISFGEAGPVVLDAAGDAPDPRHVLGAIDVHGDRLRARVDRRRSGRGTLEFMKAVRLEYAPERRIRWIQDSRAHHWTREIRAWCEDNNVELIAVPKDAGFLKRIDYELLVLMEALAAGGATADEESLLRAVDEHVQARNAPVLVRVAPAAAAVRPPMPRLLPAREGRRAQGLIALLGIPLAVVAYLLGDAAPHHGARTALASVLALTLAGIGEEIVFRGALLRFLSAPLGTWALPVVSLLFASVYLSAPPAYIVFIAVVGALFGLAVVRTGHIAGVVGAHVLMGVIGFVLLPVLL